MKTKHYLYVSILIAVASCFVQYHKYMYLLNTEKIMTSEQDNGMAVAVGIVLYPMLLLLLHALVHLILYKLAVQKNDRIIVQFHWLMFKGNNFGANVFLLIAWISALFFTFQAVERYLIWTSLFDLLIIINYILWILIIIHSQSFSQSKKRTVEHLAFIPEQMGSRSFFISE